VTHIHVDHAGGAGALLERFPHATVWVHASGARHLIDPERLLASTARTYGHDRMRSLFGEMVPIPAERVRAVEDGDRIPMGGRSLSVVHTPGHASHHVALHDDASGAMITGEAIGSYLPWAQCFRPALPPPEVDVEAALASIQRIADRAPTTLLTSHFGAVPDVEIACTRAAERIRPGRRMSRRCSRPTPRRRRKPSSRCLVAPATSSSRTPAARSRRLATTSSGRSG
jgi:glyoxylase-like metal-dependent hydrolase (beta-lactamase superfamily II)